MTSIKSRGYAPSAKAHTGTLRGASQSKQGGIMSNIPTRKELLDLWDKKQDVFEKNMAERLKKYRYTIDSKLKVRLYADGNLHINLNDNPDFQKDISRIVGKCVGMALVAFIDAISTPEAKPSTEEEIQFLKRQVDRLWGELFKVIIP
jgi:hypothetical protein